MAIIKAENVSIRYITGDFKDIGFKEYIMLKMKGKYHVKEFWADRDINFELEKGDMLGIIGTNGAGKSTLLKAVSGIMKPTKGRMIINGTVAALLELASGFDGELTVRENAYLRGAMLGYTRKFMDEKYREIIEFAELDAFQNRPFKQLSSGMKSRLAFSIACLVKPDILILDEVLSVGDGAFRKKSGDKMQEILSSGVTGILVSHSLGQVRELCNKILWLDHGRQVEFTDDVEGCCDRYEQRYLGKVKNKKLENQAKSTVKIVEKESAAFPQIDKVKIGQDKLITVWREIFQHDIERFSWIKDKNFEDDINMIGYRYLDIMAKLLDKMCPQDILDIGLFGNAKMAYQYSFTDMNIKHVIIEENVGKGKVFYERRNLRKNTEIFNLLSAKISYRNNVVRVFVDFVKMLSNKKFDFISIKAPAGGDMKDYSRIDILNLLPGILQEKFAIMIGDVERQGEANTVKEIRKILEKYGIEYEMRKYYGDKDFIVITSRGSKLEKLD